MSRSALLRTRSAAVEALHRAFEAVEAAAQGDHAAQGDDLRRVLETTFVEMERAIIRHFREALSSGPRPQPPPRPNRRSGSQLPFRLRP